MCLDTSTREFSGRSTVTEHIAGAIPSKLIVKAVPFEKSNLIINHPPQMLSSNFIIKV